jgi:hypothetical protein
MVILKKKDMESEIKNCQNCHKIFTIEQEDFNYYEKIKVPPPTWCPECRMIRRLASCNALYVFFDNCAKCGKRTLSMHSPAIKKTIYCQACWWSDSWDGTEYSMDYDSSRSFVAQLQELSDKTPYPALESSYLTLKNCDYCNALAYSKDCTLIFWADYCESVFYSTFLNGLKWSSDCLRGWESELCYEDIGLNKNYRTFFSDECDSCVDVWFSRNCYSCTNCIGCVNLRGASNYIFNVKFSKEDYEQKVKELKLDSWEGIQEVKKKAHEFWQTLPYREYNGHSLNLNVTGDHVYTSKNSKECFMVNGAENCKYCQLISVASTKDCMDYSLWGHNSELVYESASVGDGASNIKFSAYCFPDSQDSEYCLWGVASKNNFGCVNLKRKSYCILNKQYSKEEYQKLKAQIVEDMKKNPYLDERGRVWSYGEFMQPALSKLAYNYSNAMRFFPKSKEEVLTMGYIWDDFENPSVVVTMKAENIPDTIIETKDEILQEVIECDNCKRGYRIITGELELLRKLNLPVPHQCPKCRENARFARMTKPGMHHRSCDKCKKEIYTPYSPEDPRIVYCVSCYQQEFA